MARTHPPTLIREWRRHRGLTLQQLGDMVGLTHSGLGRIETGDSPYKQRHLESIAAALGTDPASLLVRHPRDPEGIWALWETLSPAQRRRVVAIIKALIEADSKNG
jgi:transcriptional regulator with XRE-family HTH domain